VPGPDHDELPVPAIVVPGVIRSKLAPDRLPRGSVQRPALLDRLRSGRGRALTLLCAPAGYGKTTLLTEWVATDNDTQFAWVTLDVGDREPVRLWTHLLASLAATDLGVSNPDFGRRTLDEVRAHPDRIGDFAAPLLLEELAGSQEHLVVILDDYHRAESVEVDGTIEPLVQYLPDHVQLVISTRSDPALAVPRLRASGDLVEVRAELLRFDDAELSAFFDGMGIVGLSPADEKRLSDRTGGWPAPLRLAALLLPAEDRSDFIESFTGANRQVVDYLTRDVLDLLAPEIRDFLLQVSVLNRLNGPLCNAVVGMSGSGAVLAELERSNVFISVDESGEWYQEHQLFAEALRLELTRTHPELVPVLHARAAAWFEKAGLLENATEHAIVARDLRSASRLVAAQVQVLASTGRSATTRGWLSDLSWPEALQDPELAFVRAVSASLENRIDEAEEWLDVAVTGPPNLKDAAGLPLGFRTDFMRGLVGINDLVRAEASALRAVGDAPSVGWEGMSLVAVGQAQYLQGRTSEALGTLLRAVAQVPDANPIMLGLAIANLALVECATGEGSQADALLLPILGVLESVGGMSTPSGALVHLAMGEKARNRGDLRAAVAAFETAIESLSGMSRSAWLANAYLLLSEAHRDLGDSAEAVRCLDQADAIVYRLPGPGALPARSRELRRQLSVPAHRTTEYGEELSERELAVLRLAAQGLSQREIADQLFISYNTVKSHLKTTYRKLGATSREDAVRRLAAIDSAGTVPTQREVTRVKSPGEGGSADG
jgi:LuxR family transcriptional regulator, maltose regulon positive regulatory protein